ncbi:hypothetical protein BC643_0546 [Mangrovibacterium diazotrophicum]|uniref:Uncharacterized protein n=1 Tax=Mangrovibacterium diazotrophicum TaxID=1261403 RepID=A0A419W439_9BACT|nr:hypothetical protein BC643_0546 [Mangrovibacterium diazotrophicum]
MFCISMLYNNEDQIIIHAITSDSSIANQLSRWLFF